MPKAKFLLFLIFILTNSCDFRGDFYSTIAENTNTQISGSTEIYNAIINYQEVKDLMIHSQSDSIFVIKNENLKSLKFLNFPKNKIITLIGKPRGYPKYGNFDYKRFQISFENLKTQGDTVECGLLIKTIGVFGEFKLKKNDKRFVVTDYNKIMI